MKIKAAQRMTALISAAVIAVFLSGCGERAGMQIQTEAQTTKITEITVQTETETETETQTETQPLIKSVDYTSKDGSVKITLPDNTWKVTQDADEMRVFQSGSAAIINIVHANTDTALKSLTVMTSSQDLQDSLTKQYSDASAFEIESFQTVTVNDVNVYRYVVKYNAAARMWAYSVTNAVIASDQAYVVTGSVTDDNKTLLDEVKTSVESFKVLADDTLKAATGDVVTGTAQPTAAAVTAVSSDTDSTEELTTLQDYTADIQLTSNDDVNVRMAPGTDADYLTVLSKGESVTVTGETTNWYQVSIDGNTGYIRKDFLVTSSESTASDSTQTSDQTTVSDTSDASSAELNTATQYASGTTLYSTSDVNVRSAPGTDSDVIDGLVAGNSVTVIGETDNWFIVSINGATGYVSKELLTSDSSQVSSSSSDTSSYTTTDASADTSGTSADTSGTSADTSGTSADTSSSSASSSPSSVSGTVIGTGADSITVQGDDGNTYSIYYGNASVTSQSGIYDGVYVNVSVDGTQTSSDGTLYATSVSAN